MEHREQRPLRVLSLDGDGIRGLSELLILKRLVYRLQPTPAGQPLAKPCDFFDVIGGTSTGGILAIALGRLEMDIDECIAFYCDLIKDLFQEPETWAARTFEYSRSATGRALLSKGKAWFNTNTLQSKLKEVIQRKLDHDNQDIQFEGPEGKCKVFYLRYKSCQSGNSNLPVISLSP